MKSMQIMKIIMILVGLLILNVLVFIHELGHMLFAKRMNVKIEEFSVGFGPTLYSRDLRGTNYCIKLIPLGGYVKMDEEQYEKEPVYKQIFVLIGGVSFNFISGLILYWPYAIFLKGYSVITALTTGTLEMLKVCWLILNSYISVFITHPDTTALSGPIGTVGVISDYISQGISSAAMIIILLSMNLVIFNLLPIPILDGGQIVIRLFKLVIKKKEYFEKFEVICGIIGLICFLGLFALGMWNDILGLIK